MSVVGDLLRDAQKLVAKKDDRSEEGFEATDKDGTPIDLTHQDASNFSVWGALQRAAFDRRDSTGLDTALVYLGANNVQDPQLKGLNKLEDEQLDKRFEEAIRLADGGAYAASKDQERKTGSERDTKKKDRASKSNTSTADQQEAEKRSGDDLPKE